MARQHIPSHAVSTGARVFVVPRDSSTPRGPNLGDIPTDGMEVQINDYIAGCLQRGALIAYGPDIVDDLAEPPKQPAPLTPPRDDEDPHV
jgi:hypothetical protein